MTIHGNLNHVRLTDAQWLTLMKIVSDEKPIDLTLPIDGKVDAELLYEGSRYLIKPDGSYLRFMPEYDG